MIRPQYDKKHEEASESENLSSDPVQNISDDS